MKMEYKLKLSLFKYLLYTVILAFSLSKRQFYNNNNSNEERESKRNKLPYYNKYIDFENYYSFKFRKTYQEVIEQIPKHNLTLVYIPYSSNQQPMNFNDECNIVNNNIFFISRKYFAVMQTIVTYDSKIIKNYYDSYIKAISKSNNNFNSSSNITLDIIKNIKFLNESELNYPYIFWYNNVDREERILDKNTTLNYLNSFVLKEVLEMTIEIYDIEDFRYYCLLYEDYIYSKYFETYDDEHIYAEDNKSRYLSNTSALFIGKKDLYIRQYKRLSKKIKEHVYDLLFQSSETELFKRYNVSEDSYDIVILKFNIRVDENVINNYNNYKNHNKHHINIHKNKVVDIIQEERLHLTDADVFNDTRLDYLLDLFTIIDISELNEESISCISQQDHYLDSLVYITKNKITNDEISFIKNIRSNYYRKDMVFYYTDISSAFFSLINSVMNIEVEELPVFVLFNNNINVIDDVQKFVIRNNKKDKDKNNSMFNIKDLISIIDSFKQKRNIIYKENYSFTKGEVSISKIIYSETIEEKISKQILINNRLNGFSSDNKNMNKVNEDNLLFEYVSGNEFTEKIFDDSNVDDNYNIVKVLLICIKKITDCLQAIEVVSKTQTFLFNNMYKLVNQEDITHRKQIKIRFYTVDPFINEISHINYTTSPSLYLIQDIDKNNDEVEKSKNKKLIINNKSISQFIGSFNSKNILEFILKQMHLNNNTKFLSNSKTKKIIDSLRNHRVYLKDSRNKEDFSLTSKDLKIYKTSLRRTIVVGVKQYQKDYYNKLLLEDLREDL